MSWLLSAACLLLCGPALLQGKASEYQLETETLSRCELLRGEAVTKRQGDAPHCTEDGRFRPVQCSGRSQECWCVDAEGREIIGTRTNSSVLHCATPCQQQKLLQCSPSGLFESVQCDSSREQCWCVDQDGMELYGTRQNGRPQRCPGSCEVRSRRLLHGSASSSPPQCGEDGQFLPVQCRFINTTDRSEVDLLNAFNRFPEAFETFTNFQKTFPLVSSYCFCSDSRGRELENTGVELLLSQVYDSAFAGLPSGRSVSDSNVYRVLQRRMLGVRLALTGHFRCPTPCEEERRAAQEMSSAFVPSCDARGAYSSRQCQRGATCWCVDPTGTEIPGTRRRGDAPLCGSGPGDCPSRRRLSLSRLLSGPVEPPSSQPSPGSSPCLSLLRPLRDVLPAEVDASSFLSQLAEVLHGLFPSVGGALRALVASSPKRLQENLFGGKFLQQLAASNLSAALGSEGPVSVEQFSRRSVNKNQNLIQTVSRVLQDQNFLSSLELTVRGLSGSSSHTLQQVLTPLLRSCSEEEDGPGVFVPSCTPSGDFQEVQCGSGACWCVDGRGREVEGSRTSGGRPRCPSRCERERTAALKVASQLAAGARLYVPECSESGDFLPLQCVDSRCFCVDAEGRRMIAGPAGGAVTCPETSPQKIQTSEGGCAETLAEVAAFRRDALSIAALSNSSHIPLGYGFLLAEGLRLTAEELQVDQSEGERLQVSDRLLSRSKAALRLAALSTLQTLRPAQRRSYQPFTPQCDANGHWLLTQCYRSTGQCWCVDEDGEYIAGSLTGRSLRLPKCPTRCERAQAHALLSDWTKGSDLSSASSYRPSCEQDGSYSVLQTGGAAGWCVNPLTGETLQAATPSAAGLLTCPSWCQLQGFQCRPDGSFQPLQCDIASCWCVSEDGREVGGTRAPRQTGSTPSCDRPLCPAPVLTHGALLCRPATEGQQSCELICHHGYQNSLPISSFQCDTENQRWGGDSKPVGGACQISQPVQTLSTSQSWSLSSSCSQTSTLQSALFDLMASRGLCSAQLPASLRSVSLCDDSSVSVTCDSEGSLRLKVTWTLTLSDVPTSDLPDLRDVAVFLNESRLLEQVQGILGNIRSKLTSDPKLLSTMTATFGCSNGYRLDGAGDGCIICPAGSFSREGACLPCPEGTYQDQEGRDFCNRCPKGSSPSGAWSVSQCVTECEGRGLRCSPSGDFLPAQHDSKSDRWGCVSAEGAELEWTLRQQILSDEECSVLRRFQNVPRSELIVGAGDAEVLQTMTSDLIPCVKACAAEPSCHHVALLGRQTQCELYSTHTLNTHCNASQQTNGFLGNPRAEFFDWLSCSVKVRGGASDMQVIRKKGAAFSSRSFRRMMMRKVLSGVFRTQVFSSSRTSLADAHRSCEDGCSRDACCHGFILNQNVLNGGSLFCGWLNAPSVLMCGDQDWDVIGQGKANRICGAGLTYNQQQRGFLFDFGGEKFDITESALPADSKNKKDYQASIIIFQGVYLNPGAASSAVPASPSCAPVKPTPPPDGSVQLRFQPVSGDEVVVDPQRTLPSLSFLLNSDHFTSQQALRWCLTRCEAEPQCFVADVRDDDQAGFFSCSLYPDSRVCGMYDTSKRLPCRHQLDRAPNNTYSKTVDLLGPVKSFYQRVPFQEMVSYSVRSKYTLTANTPLSTGFMQCERRCDEDPCCRGFGLVRYKATKSEAQDIMCLSLISLGVQTCSEDDMTLWTTRDCGSSGLITSPEPFGWYQKPVNQWSSSPALCPSFTLPPTKNNVSADEWRSLSASSVLVDPSLPTYDVIHVSRDIATNRDETRDWCLHACQEAESCVAASLREAESATRCVLYPDTTVCGLHSANPTSSKISCRLVIKEPAPQVYLRTKRSPSATSVTIQGHGILRGVAGETALGSGRRRVVQFLGVPYARPPTGSLRFKAAQPADWTGTWDATKPRAGCVQPGDPESAGSSEDCLYLNVFTPAAVKGRFPVLVFFYNPSANQGPGLLDGSTLAAVGNMVVVTAGYRTAALGFLSTGGLRGNYGLSDQEAVLQWVHAHISLVGGDKERVTVGAERRGADITSLHLLSSSSSSSPLFQRMILLGGSVFSPSGLQTAPTARRQALDLARELGCVTSDLTQMVACLRATPAGRLNAAQTKLLAVSGPFLSWSPVPPAVAPSSLHRVDLLLGTSHLDGLISRARRIKDFEALQGRADGKTAFYEALSRSLGGASGGFLLKEAATWFYSLDHSPSAAGYNLFSRALENATRDLFIICPTLQMASHWANGKANVFLFHQPASSSHSRADASVPLDIQLIFGTPHQPIGSQRFSPSERRLSAATMSYVSSFVHRGNPNPSHLWAESALPRWQPVRASEASPTYLELSPALRLQSGLRQNACSFWNRLGTRLTQITGGVVAEPLQAALTPELPLADAQSGQSQSGKDAYN